MIVITDDVKEVKDIRGDKLYYALMLAYEQDYDRVCLVDNVVINGRKAVVKIEIDIDYNNPGL